MAEKKETQWAVVEQIRGSGTIHKIWWFDARRDARAFRDNLEVARKRGVVTNTKLVVKPMKRGPRA